MVTKRLLVSVDVDSLELYLGLYGHGSPSGGDGDLVSRTYELGVRRFQELFREFDLSGVFFLVGKDLLVPQAADVAREVVGAGHELANHTWSHPYDFIHLPESQAVQEVVMCHEAIAEIAGTEPRVFRAPGYNMTSREYGILSRLGYSTDMSPLPSYPYLAAKYAVLAGLTLTGRASRSIWGSPRAFLGPRQPWERDGVEVIPCATTRWLRLPIIGTALSTAPEPLFQHLMAEAALLDTLSLEFHAVDLMGLAEDRLPAALASQRDLAIPVETKRNRFRRLLERVSMAPPRP
jgi:hypothetical protein